MPYERLLRGIAAAKGLSCRRALTSSLPGFLIQIASAVFPAWELPNWTLRLVIALLLIGFPIALILAWAYDITAARDSGHARKQELIGDEISSCSSLTLVIVSASAGFFLLPRAVWHKVDKSVAVLPFQNLSSDPENAYFADGIQEEVLTRLDEDRGFKSDFARFDAAVSERTGQSC